LLLEQARDFLARLGIGESIRSKDQTVWCVGEIVGASGEFNRVKRESRVSEVVEEALNDFIVVVEVSAGLNDQLAAFRLGYFVAAY